jgi:hypothetical protein
MGFCYEGRKLVCDLCSTAGARRRKCPAGYCQAIAVCPSCGKDPGFKAKWKGLHTNCEASHARYVAHEEEEKRMLSEGKFLRCSASTVEREGGPPLVHVLFKGKDGNCVGYYMSPETYEAFTLGSHRTPEDYATAGQIMPAPDKFSWGGTSKQVAP